MKAILTVAALCLTITLTGCKDNKDSSSSMTSPGAMTECGTDCESKCCDKDTTSYGAVGEKSDCASSCTKEDASMGAVSDDCASKCEGAKSSCTESDASMGAVSEKASCPMSSSCGEK